MSKLITALSLAFGALLFTGCGKDDNDDVTAMSEAYRYRDANTAITLPTAFTPNGDGHNDIYRPVLFGALPPAYAFTIYTQDGRQIFQTTQAGGWNGYNNLTNAYYPAGNYRVNISFAPAGGTAVNENFFFTLPPYNSVSKCWQTNGKLFTFEDQIDPQTGEVSRPTMESLCDH